VLDRSRGAEPRVRAAEGLGDAGQPPGEALDVRLVDDGVGERDRRRRVVRPVERPTRHHAVRDERRGVAAVADVGVAGEALVDDVPEGLRAQVQPSVQGPGVGVEEQLGRVVAVAEGGLPPAGGAVAVPGADADARYEPVPDPVRAFGELDLAFDPSAPLGRVEHAEPDAVGVRGEHRHLRPAVPQPQAERMRSGAGGVRGHGRQSAPRRRHRCQAVRTGSSRLGTERARLITHSY
jgi:hypothetical protein